MFVRYFSAAALALHSAQAFKDASPFFLSSTSQIDVEQLHDAHVASSSGIESSLLRGVKDCTSDTYVFVSQPGVSSADFAAYQSMPHLRRRVNGEDKATKNAIKISNVVGDVDWRSLLEGVQSQCPPSSEKWELVEVDGTSGVVPHLNGEAQGVDAIHVTFSSPPADKEERASALARYDSYLDEVLQQLDAYTLIYTTTPPSSELQQEVQQPEHYYNMDEPFPSGMHGDLKRDLEVYPRASNGSNLDSNLPLFEKYQFVNQGIFIGGSVTLLLLLILSVGLRAIANLEVSYMAFSKEMGPAAQKKQQGQ